MFLLLTKSNVEHVSNLIIVVVKNPFSSEVGTSQTEFLITKLDPALWLRRDVHFPFGISITIDFQEKSYGKMRFYCLLLLMENGISYIT